MKKLTGTLLVAGLLLGSCPLGSVGSREAAPQTVIAHADNTGQTQGTLGTVPWQVTTDGTLHLGAGTLPSAQGTRGPVRDLIEQLAANPTGITVTTLAFEGRVKTPSDGKHLLASMATVTTIQGMENLDTSETTAFDGMFYGNAALEKLDASHLDLSHATSVQSMFAFNESLTELKFSDQPGQQSLGEAKDLMNFISNNYELTKLDLSGLDVSGIKSFFMTLTNDGNIEELDLHDWRPAGQLGSLYKYETEFNLRKLTLSRHVGFKPDTLPALGKEAFPEFDAGLYTGKWVNQDDQALDAGDPQKRAYTTAELTAQYDGTHVDDLPANATYVWELRDGAPVTVSYVDQAGRALRDPLALTGKVAADYTIATPEISGYQFDHVTGRLAGKYTDQPQRVTLVYRTLPVVPNPAPVVNDSGSTPGTGGAGNQVSAQSVTALKKIGLYRTPNFSAKTRVRWHDQRVVPYRPRFEVQHTATSKKGVLRYFVRDVNRDSRTYGQTGYITAKTGYVRATYAASEPKTIRVTAKTGLNGYRQATLKQKLRHYRQGQRLKVKKLVHRGTTARYLLSNGQYVSANRDFSRPVR